MDIGKRFWRSLFLHNSARHFLSFISHSGVHWSQVDLLRLWRKRKSSCWNL